MRLADYLAFAVDPAEEKQAAWFSALRGKIETGQRLWQEADAEKRRRYSALFLDRVRTEELKAWYGAPERAELFQGTSVTALTVPAELPAPLLFSGGIADLEDAAATHYIAAHDRIESTVRETIMENTDFWMSEGVFFGLVIGSKTISQAFNLSVPADDLVFSVDGVQIDPHQITTYPTEIRRRYFELCRDRIACFRDIPDLKQEELEAALVLADISKPYIEQYRNRLILAPVRCNEIAAVFSRRVADLIRRKSGGRISPRSLMVTIYDTDTPYTYHQICGHYGDPSIPVLPGLVILGTSGTTDAFRWLYAYRCSLVAQKMMKGSLWSQVESKFVPFVFFGVLVERDAEILLDLDRLSLLRYRGNLSPQMEFLALLPSLDIALSAARAVPPPSSLHARIS